MHKEKMQMLYAFEQLIINTEDEDDQDYYDEIYGVEEAEEGIGGGMIGYGMVGGGGLPGKQRVPIEAEYLSNPSDIIDEEEYEDSEEEKEYH